MSRKELMLLLFGFFYLIIFVTGCTLQNKTFDKQSYNSEINEFIPDDISEDSFKIRKVRNCFIDDNMYILVNPKDGFSTVVTANASSEFVNSNKTYNLGFHQYNLEFVKDRYSLITVPLKTEVNGVLIEEGASGFEHLDFCIGSICESFGEYDLLGSCCIKYSLNESECDFINDCVYTDSCQEIKCSVYDKDKCLKKAMCNWVDNPYEHCEKKMCSDFLRQELCENTVYCSWANDNCQRKH